jgi:small subunit ribosomal protein S5
MTEEKKENLEKNSKSLSLDTKTEDIPTKNVDVKPSTNKEMPKKDEPSKSSKVEEKSVIQNSAKIDGVMQKTSKVKDDKKNEKLTAKMSTGKDKTTSPKHKSPNTSDSQNKVVEQNEYIEKLVSINRVAKVVKGGRRFSFAALVVVGDGNGMVGHGKGKAKEVPEAIKKATDEAKNRMIRVPLRQGKTLHHDIKGRFDSGKVYLRSAPSGTGVIAGGPMRAVFEALGIQDIVAKSVGTSNPHNMVRATFEALKSASSPKIIAMRRGLKINDITKRRKVNQPGTEDGKN